MEFIEKVTVNITEMEQEQHDMYTRVKRMQEETKLRMAEKREAFEEKRKLRDKQFEIFRNSN